MYRKLELRLRVIVVAALFLVGLCSKPIFAASFDCSKAATGVEKMICSDARLSKLDEELSVVYAKVLSEKPYSTEIRQQQRDWLKGKRNKCMDALCLRIAYAGRIAEINDIISDDAEKLKEENEEGKTPLLGYVKNYKPVDIVKRLGGVYYSEAPRPSNMFQLVAFRDEMLCRKFMEKFNQAGTYKGGDASYWWINNDSLAKWGSSKPDWYEGRAHIYLDPNNFVPSTGGYQTISDDVDGNGVVEFVYRVGTDYRGNEKQYIGIFNVDLKSDESQVSQYLGWICKTSSKDICSETKEHLKKPEADLVVSMLLDRGAPLSERWGAFSKEVRSATFIEDYSGEPDPFALVNAVKFGNRYAIFFYPPRGHFFEIHLFLLNGSKLLSPECVFSPNV